MKGGDVVLLLCPESPGRCGSVARHSHRGDANGDEESVGRPIEKSRGDMIALARRSDFALSFEGGRWP